MGSCDSSNNKKTQEPSKTPQNLNTISFHKDNIEEPSSIPELIENDPEIVQQVLNQYYPIDNNVIESVLQPEILNTAVNMINSLEPSQLNSLLESTAKVILKDFNSFDIDYSHILEKGPFGTVYLGNNKYTNEKVAIKLETKKQGFYSYILNEINIYEKLGSYHSIPNIYWSGPTKDYNAIIMEILGDSLEKVFIQKNNQFSIPEVMTIGSKILGILEYIHNKNIIHRDINTNCFLTKNKNLFQIYIINFGNAKEYINPKTGNHIPFTQGNNYIGDYKFKSRNAVLGLEMSRRDDIESLGYILIYFLKGNLPWSNSNDYNYIKNKKLSISLDDLCKDLPLGIKNFIEYSWKLGFYDKPDYLYLSNLLKKF